MTDRLVSLSVQPLNQLGEKYVLDVANDFTLNPAVRAMYSAVTVASYDLDESETEEKSSEYYDDETLVKVMDALVAENFMPDAAQDIIRILQNAGILFRERA